MDENQLENKHPPKTYPDEALLSQVDPIQEGMLSVENIHQLEALVEYPLLEAAQSFFEKGIQTYASSANKKDAEAAHGTVYIILYFDTLNDTNKKIAESISEITENEHFWNKKKYKLAKIFITVNEKTTVGEVKEKFREIAAKFENQK